MFNYVFLIHTMYMYLHILTCLIMFFSYTLCTCIYIYLHDVIGDVERKKERKKDT